MSMRSRQDGWGVTSLPTRKSSVITSYSIHYTKLYDIPLEAKALKGQQDMVCRAGHRAWRVDVLDAHKPLTAVGTRIEIAADGRDKRAEMQRPGRRRGETAAVTTRFRRRNGVRR